MNTLNRSRGKEAEIQAREYLEHNGLKLICHNYSCRMGEIDLIMKEQKTLVFIEVRYRKQSGFGSPAETITKHKQRRIISAAQHYLLTANEKVMPPCRFDVIAMTGEGRGHIEWIKNAFQVTR